MKFYKIKTGYGKDDFISVDETELPQAVRAQITGKVGVFQNGTISGNHIITITPDFNRLMGWNRDYELKGEDYMRIGTTVINEYREFLGSINNEVYAQQLNNNLQMKRIES